MAVDWNGLAGFVGAPAFCDEDTREMGVKLRHIGDELYVRYLPVDQLIERIVEHVLNHFGWRNQVFQLIARIPVFR